MPRKSNIDLKKRINKLDKHRAVLICEKYGLPTKGRKDDLIARIVSKIPAEDIVPYFRVDELKALLEEQGLPKSGRKDELVERVLSLIRTPEGKAKPKEEKKKRTSAEKGTKSLADEVATYLEDITIGSVRLKDEIALELHLSGRLREFFKEKNIKVKDQAIGIKDRRKPDLEITRGKETVLIELKYIRKLPDYECGIGQALGYSTIRDLEGAKVVLFCYDPERKINRPIPPEYTPTVWIIIKQT